MMGGQFQAEGEEQLHYSSLKSTFEPAKINMELSLTPPPVSLEVILDESNSSPVPSTLNGPAHQLPSVISDSLLTPLLPTPSPVANIPRSHGASRALNNLAGVSTPSPPTHTSNHIARNHPQYSSIGNSDSWIPFPTSQPSAETGGASSSDLSANWDEGEQEAYLIPREEPNSHAQAMSCPDTLFWEDAETHECWICMYHVISHQYCIIRQKYETGQ